MEIYKHLYHMLFNAITETLSDLDQQNYGAAKERLIHAQLHAEAMYVEGKG